MISIVSRFEPSALRAASHTAAALVAASSTIRPTASHWSERTASNTGASQTAWVSSRAEGTAAVSERRSSSSRRGVTGPVRRTSISAGTGTVSSSGTFAWPTAIGQALGA